jgi:hypothetical protein
VSRARTAPVAKERTRKRKPGKPRRATAPPRGLAADKHLVSVTVFAWAGARRRHESARQTETSAGPGRAELPSSPSARRLAGPALSA